MTKQYRKLAILLTAVYLFMAISFSASAAADKTALQALYDANTSKTSAQYGAASFQVFDTTMKDAKVILDDADALQADIDVMVTKLTNAVNGLNLYQKGMCTVTKDSWVTSNSGNGGNNLNSDVVMNGKLPYTDTSSTARQIFLGFDISGINSDVSNITLRTFMVQCGSNGTYPGTIVNVHGCSNTAWTETGITWNNRPQAATMTPEIIATITPGIIVTQADPSNHRWLEFNVTNYVKSLILAGKTQATFVILTDNIGSSWIGISSKESPNGNAAQLVFESGMDKTIGNLMEDDLNAINIEDYINDSSIERITQSLKTIPSVGTNGYPITWKSSNTSLMSDSGQVLSRPSVNTQVTMTAIIKSDGVTHKKDFVLTLLRDTSAWSDLDFINSDLSELQFSDFSTQDPTMIASDITLPRYKYSDNGVAFTWTSSNTEEVSISDYIASFKPKTDSKVSLDLIVTATKGTASNTKHFTITLIRTFGDNLIVTRAAKVTATSGSPYAAATRNYETYWESNANDENPAIVFDFTSATSVNAVLFCERGNNISGFQLQSGADKQTWTTIYTGSTLGDKQRNLIELTEVSSRYFRFIVTSKVDANQPVSLYSTELFYGAITERQAVAMDKQLITIPGLATSNITLPTTGKHGSTITWSSSDTSVISNTGTVTAGSSTQYVMLTATIKKGDQSDTISGEVKVPSTASISYGGGGGGGSGTIAYLPNTPKYTPVPADEQRVIFGDVPSSHWAHGYIIDLADKGIISETEKFRPEDSITREEFLKMLVIMAGLKTETSEAEFSDVDENEWYNKYIATAVMNGIVTGMGDGSFGIGKSIIRQDMAVMAERLIDKLGKLPGASDMSGYTDRDSISKYAQSAVAVLSSMKVLSGNENGEFMPANNTTRAEASKIISLLYEILNS